MQFVRAAILTTLVLLACTRQQLHAESVLMTFDEIPGEPAVGSFYAAFGVTWISAEVNADIAGSASPPKSIIPSPTATMVMNIPGGFNELNFDYGVCQGNIHGMVPIVELYSLPDASGLLLATELLLIMPISCDADTHAFQAENFGVARSARFSYGTIGQSWARFDNVAVSTLNLPICTGDLNSDGEVGSSDLAVMLGFWGASNPPLGDLNGDTTVDALDLSILLGNWGACL